MRNSKLLVIAFISAVLLISPLLFSQVGLVPELAQAQTGEATDGTLSETITVVGEGTVQVEPDTAQATIGVQISNQNLEEATSTAQQRMEAVLAALQEQGVAAQDIQTANFNIFMESPVGPGPEGQASTEPTYRVSNDVQVTIRDLNNIGAILNAAIEAGANNIYGVNFSVSDDSEARVEAREEAFNNAANQAQALADLAGIELGEVVRISEVISNRIGGPFAARGEGIGGGGGGPIVPGQLQVSTQLEVTYAMQ